MKSTFKATKKALAILLSLAFVFSAIFCMPVMAEDEVTTEPPVTEEPEVPEEPAEIVQPTPDLSVKRAYNSGNLRSYVADFLDNKYFTSGMMSKNPVVTSDTNANLTDIPNATMSAAKWKEFGTNENSVVRFWIKAPYRKGTPELGYRVYFNYAYSLGSGTKYQNFPTTTGRFNLPADGLWHEIRVKSTDFPAFKTFNFDAVTSGTMYVRVNANNATAQQTSGEYICTSPIQFFYTEDAVAAINATPVDDGNIGDHGLVKTLNGSRQDYVKTMNVTSVVALDNKLLRSVKKISPAEGYTLPESSTEIKLMPYSASFSVAEGETENELADWFNGSGEMRTFVKNDSNNDIQFMIGLYASTGGSYPNYKTGYITIPANSGWKELRISSTYMTGNNNSSEGLIKAHSGTVSLYLYTKSDIFMDESTDALYIAPVELYSSNVLEPVTTDFAREYTRVLMNGKYTKGDDEATIKKTEGKACEDNPRFEKINTFTTGEDYVAAANQVVSVWGITNQVSDDFAGWLFNPDAELRFYAKSDRERTFKFTIQTYASGSYKNITATVTIPAAEGWQEVVVKRSAFNTNSDMNSNILNSSKFNAYVRWTTDANTFVANDSLTISSQVEFYSDKSYLKGDVNADGVENVKDIIRMKKIIAKGEGKSVTEVNRADADSNGWISAVDLVALRKILLNLV